MWVEYATRPAHTQDQHTISHAASADRRSRMERGAAIRSAAASYHARIAFPFLIALRPLRSPSRERYEQKEIL